ncbi:MAG TPA: hypothetical protein VE570_10615, partial [Thermoleophilaceae bacterium]|nr:hypothetical protein [Thermoleophilaceae bacterium]
PRWRRHELPSYSPCAPGPRGTEDHAAHLLPPGERELESPLISCPLRTMSRSAGRDCCSPTKPAVSCRSIEAPLAIEFDEDQAPGGARSEPFPLLHS